MKIAVVGTGYVGLVVGACLAESGNDVICVDKDESKVRMLKRGSIPIYEPGLEEIVKRNKAEGRLTFVTNLPRAVKASQIVFIAVGTPQGEDGSADLQHVLAVARDVARAMDGYRVIVNKSTVPVGTAERVREIVRRETTHPFSVVSNPEFLKQGAAVDDFMKPDRVVIGAEDPRGADLMVALHKPFTRTGAPIMVMDCASAELSKYASNALLATKISFMNEIANICDAFGADVDQVRQAVGSDRRIGPSFLFPGVGYGGSCFPKDVKALVKFSADRKYDFKILKAVESVNELQKRQLVKKIDAHFKGNLKGKTIAVWGLAFKPKTDDMREAPAVPIISALLEKGAKVQAYDPEAMKVAKGIFGSKITYATKPYDALNGADALAVITEWHEFREPDFPRMRKLLARARGVRRAQHLRERADEDARLHLLFDREVAMSRVLVTGGAGYIGSHAVRALVDAGHTIAVLDDLSAGHSAAVPPGVPLVRCEMHDTGRVVEALTHHRVDAVMHFAAWLDVGGSVVESDRLLPQQRDRHAVGARGHAPDRCPAVHLLVHLRHLRRADAGADGRDAGSAADQRLRRDQAGHRAGVAASRAGARHPLHRAALFQCCRRPSRRHASAKTTLRRFTSSRARFRPRRAGRR